jgi:hypothetical protein
MAITDGEGKKGKEGRAEKDANGLEGHAGPSLAKELRLN